MPDPDPTPTPRPPQPADLIALAIAVDADDQRPRDEVRRRDRAIGRALPTRRSSDAARVMAWLDAAHVRADGERRHAAALAQRGIGFGLIALGLAMGWGVTTGLFYYDGGGRVNVLGILAVFVALQVVLIALTLVAALPREAVARVPVLGPAFDFVVDAARVLSPGRLYPLLAKLLPQAPREAIRELMGRGAAHHRVYGRVQKWVVVTWAQLFAVAFHVAAVWVAVWLVLFSDLAFGWSTTLALEPAVFHRITSAIALPWAWGLPESVPSLELVERTRYFRLTAGADLPDDPAALGRWWPFAVLAMLTYGLVPRLVLLIVAAGRLRAAVHEAVVLTPGVRQVLDRMDRELVETRSHAGDGGAEGDDGDGEAADADTGSDEDWPQGPHAVINWARVPVLDPQAAALLEPRTGASPVSVAHAGGEMSLAEDDAALRGAAAGEPAAVTVIVRGWEPPTGDAVDFLKAARETIGDGVPIILATATLTPPPEGPREAPPEAPPVADATRGGADPHGDAIADWRRKAKQLGDPWLQLIPLPLPRAPHRTDP